MINWHNEDWAYMLGVIHGDGSISTRSVRISVGYKDQAYGDVLAETWERLGYAPKVYRPRSALAIDVHSKALRDALAPYKANGIWQWPDGLNQPEYLAGVFDTDGYASLSAGKKQIGITLKRSGNLARLAEVLRGLGIPDVEARDEVSAYGGKPYEIETIRITDAARIVQLARLLKLRNERKAQMLEAVRAYAQDILDRVPLWKQIGLWLEENGPADWREIAEAFGLSKAQFESAMQHLKRNAEVNVIPPPIMLTRYEVKQWKGK